MDIYRFFHPHHNPRLHSTPMRQQELSELEQAAAELRKSLERARQRTARRACPPILPEHFSDIIKAMRFVEQSLQTLCDAHPGDTETMLSELIGERSDFTGWEGWTALVREQLNVGRSAGNGDGTAERLRARPSESDSEVLQMRTSSSVRGADPSSSVDERPLKISDGPDSSTPESVEKFGGDGSPDRPVSPRIRLAG